VSAANYGRVTATRNLSHLGARAIKLGPSTTSPVRLQLGVLLCCQAQEYRAPSNLERLVQRLPSLYAEDHAHAAVGESAL